MSKTTHVSQREMWSKYPIYGNKYGCMMPAITLEPAFYLGRVLVDEADELADLSDVLDRDALA